MKFLAATLLIAMGLTACSSSSSSSDSTAKTASTESTAAPSGDAAAIDTIVQNQMKTHALNAVIVRVTLDGKDVVTKAYGNSMTGVPATTDMHFRNGAVEISYVAMAVLRL